MIGFIAARSDLLPASLRAPQPAADPAIAQTIAETTDRLAALENTLANLPGPEPQTIVSSDVDLGPLSDQIADLSARVDAITPLAERLNVLTARVDALAARPEPEAAVPDDAMDAALAELRDTAATQQAEIDRLLNAAREIQSSAEADANATLVRAALTRIMSAVDTGSPFAAALGDLEAAGATDIPDALHAAAADGVTPLATLQETIPDAARDALAAARSESGGGLGGFLQRQLGTRSVAPREGDDPDAVLSRVEAAVRAGRLGDALAEAELLPDPARAAMGAWLEQAQARQDAVAAANALAERLSAL